MFDFKYITQVSLLNKSENTSIFQTIPELFLNMQNNLLLSEQFLQKKLVLTYLDGFRARTRFRNKFFLNYQPLYLN